jgi:D-lactate dehydrogenase
MTTSYRIGPDPASIDSAMIGGIAANNASGMCCGVDQNSYKTVADMRLLLVDGTVLDTADPASVAAFRQVCVWGGGRGEGERQGRRGGGEQ